MFTPQTFGNSPPWQGSGKFSKDASMFKLSDSHHEGIQIRVERGGLTLLFFDAFNFLRRRIVIIILCGLS